jgi:hypothetical protein
MAFSKSERLYMCIQPNRLVEWNTATNSLLREVVGGFSQCLGMVCDPISGDLFLTDNSVARVYRVSNFESGTPAVQIYFESSTLGTIFDGIAVTPAGRFYLALYGSNGGVYTLNAVTDPGGPGGRSIAPVPTMDGISVGVNLFDIEYPPYVIANNNDGTLKQVDLQGSGSVDRILSGGTRGDFSVVGYDGCIYATQGDRVVKIASSTGQCLDLYPTCPNRVPVLAFIPPGYENVTIGQQFCTQVSFSDNVESLSWTCSVDWGDFTSAEACSITRNPQTISLCHTYASFFAGYLPITVTVTDDQRFPSGARKFVQTIRTSASSAGSATSTGSGSVSVSATGSSNTNSASTNTNTNTASTNTNTNTASSNTNSVSSNSATVVLATSTDSGGSGLPTSSAMVLPSSICLVLIAAMAVLFALF